MDAIKTVLVDRRNFADVKDQIQAEIAAADFVGLDCETQDDARHEGLNRLCKYDPVTRKKPANSKLIFDFRRMVMCGFSLYAEGSDTAYYFNLDHADEENRLVWNEVQPLLDASKQWIAHNAAFELTVFQSCYGYKLDPIIDTMQMAVSAFGPDEYAFSDFLGADQGGIKKLVPDLIRHSLGYTDPQNITPELEELMTKILAKQSTSEWSYNGWVKNIAYSYGLKRLVKHFFGYQMTTFEEVLGDKAHMGQLTGDEVATYGADDAYWVVPLFHKLLEYMTVNCPGAIQTFFDQENPMVPVYSSISTGGWRVNFPAINQNRADERANNAQLLRELKAIILQMLPFPEEPHPGLVKRDKWYVKNWDRYRNQIAVWANTPDSDDDFTQNYQVRGAVANSWAAELGKAESIGVNLSHYMPQRTLLYDLTGTKLLLSQGKTQSDGEARGKLKDRFQKEGNDLAVQMIDKLNALAGVDQRIKLFIEKYVNLTDPETGRMYPTVTSMLATRRMAASEPNPMQLAKRGESVYVRGYFEGDDDDHVVISVDWSGIELVEIGEFSGDPEFIKAFGQIPHEDLHGGASAAVLSVPCPGMTPEFFLELKKETSEEAYRDRHKHNIENLDRVFTDTKGQPLLIDKAHKYWRTEIGKGANFNYWYSGALATIGEKMGWSSDQMWKATEAYRERFAVAEAWRMALINEVKQNGFITLPDGHTRVRFEATDQWRDLFTRKFMLDEVFQYNQAWQYMAGKIQKRAFNQAVNAYIQGSCATIAKRSVIRIIQKRNDMGWTDRELRFLCPIHDELVWTAHKSVAVEAINLIRNTMIDHPDLFTKCKLDASPSVGLTFEPWNEKKAPLGQVELYEAPNFSFLPEKVWGGRMNDDQMRETIDYLFHQRGSM